MKLNARILLLDDEPLVQMILRVKLEQAGAFVAEARSCAEAMELAGKTDFDAGVFDHCLPDGNGLDVVRELRRQGFGFPVVMLSSDAGDIAKTALEIDGICAVQSKPPNAKAVLEAVSSALGCAVEREAERIGRYAYWNAGLLAMVPEGCAHEEWLAIDFTSMDDDVPHGSVMDCLDRMRSGTVVIGAKSSMRWRIEALRRDIEFVSTREELAALSRHPSTPAERTAVLLSVTT